MKKNNTAKTPVTVYEPVSENVYFDGSSYRTRVSVNGNKYSQSFRSKRKAIAYRNQLLAQ
jgi:hypothetical protein